MKKLILIIYCLFPSMLFSEEYVLEAVTLVAGLASIACLLITLSPSLNSVQSEVTIDPEPEEIEELDEVFTPMRACLPNLE